MKDEEKEELKRLVKNTVKEVFNEEKNRIITIIVWFIIIFVIIQVLNFFFGGFLKYKTNMISDAIIIVFAIIFSAYALEEQFRK